MLRLLQYLGAKMPTNYHLFVILPSEARGESSPVKYTHMSKTFYVYILASKRNGTLYIGVTNDLYRRVWEHKHKINYGFTAKYDVNKLVYYEEHEDVEEAIVRKKRLKRFLRKEKLTLIESVNPSWQDLSKEWY